MAKRRGPRDGGYSFGEKERYRREVWASIQRALPVPTCQAHCLLMPSLEGAEIVEVLDRGFVEEHLHVVDMNPAIVATLKRRFAKLNTYGVSASRACQRIATAGIELHAANFDFTGCIGPVLWLEMLRIGQAAPFAHRSAIAFTVLRGRESPKAFRFLETASQHACLRWAAERIRRTCINRTQLSSVDVWRVQSAAWTISSNLSRPLRTAIYKSPNAKQTMLWHVMASLTPAGMDAEGAALMEQHKAALAALDSPDRQLRAKTRRVACDLPGRLEAHADLIRECGQTGEGLGILAGLHRDIWQDEQPSEAAD